MKKNIILLMAALMILSVPAFSADASSTDAVLTNPISSFFSKLWKFNDDINAKIDAQQAKNAEQQRKYEQKKAEREQKIKEEQQKRQEIYEANQKRLEEKREQLRILLEE